MKISPIIIVLLAVVLSVASAGLMVVLNYDAMFKPKPEIKAEFTSVEFDADDTSYSPAETHSMNQLSKELAALKEKLLERENELDSRESAIAMDLEALEKQKKEMNQIQEDLSARLADFEARQGQDLSEEKLKEYKDTSKRWVEMGPEVASVEIQNWRQKRRFEEALSIFELLKSEDKAPIISFMLNSDDDSLIELADALAMRDRGLLPSLDLDDLAPVGIPAN
jgi:flagellar biosynthesis GTPase FlhF|tara:strand:+ start:3106 stop:3777 length:672 start_codon:yes stop_codon:yes gene_type:complete